MPIMFWSLAENCSVTYMLLAIDEGFGQKRLIKKKKTQK